MVNYRISLFDLTGHPISTQEFDCVADAGALLLSAAMVTGRARAEIWAGERNIGTINAIMSRGDAIISPREQLAS